MVYRDGNYAAFYVAEPFSESNLGASATRDFVYYNMLRMWKGKDSSFPFIDSHNKTYNVRDGSDWGKTLKPRLQQRLDNSKNIILFLSSKTISSRALQEEINYGVGEKGLPVIVVYPDFKSKSDIIYQLGSTADSTVDFRQQITSLWDKLPCFRNKMGQVATLHVPLDKKLITLALQDKDFMVNTMTAAGAYFFQ